MQAHIVHVHVHVCIPLISYNTCTYVYPCVCVCVCVQSWGVEWQRLPWRSMAQAWSLTASQSGSSTTRSPQRSSPDCPLTPTTSPMEASDPHDLSLSTCIKSLCYCIAGNLGEVFSKFGKDRQLKTHHYIFYCMALRKQIAKFKFCQYLLRTN